MSKLSHCVSPLILIQVFCPLPILWLPSDLFSSFSGESLSGLDGHQREASMEDGLSHPLFVLLASFSALCCTYCICMLCQYHKFSPSSISPALRSTKGLKYYPLCGLFIQGCLTKRWVCTSFLKIFEATVYTTWHKGKVSSWCESFSSVFLSRGLSEPLFTELLCCLKPKQCSAVHNRAVCITEIKWYFMVSDSEVGKKGRL